MGFNKEEIKIIIITCLVMLVIENIFMRFEFEIYLVQCILTISIWKIIKLVKN